MRMEIAQSKLIIKYVQTILSGVPFQVFLGGRCLGRRWWEGWVGAGSYDHLTLSLGIYVSQTNHIVFHVFSSSSLSIISTTMKIIVDSEIPETPQITKSTNTDSRLF